MFSRFYLAKLEHVRLFQIFGWLAGLSIVSTKPNFLLLNLDIELEYLHSAIRKMVQLDPTQLCWDERQASQSAEDLEETHMLEFSEIEAREHKIRRHLLVSLPSDADAFLIHHLWSQHHPNKCQESERPITKTSDPRGLIALLKCLYRL